MLNKEQIKQARKEVSEKIISLPEGPQRICYEVLEGRISFIDPATNKPKSGNNSGTVIVYFKKKISTKDYKNDK